MRDYDFESVDLKGINEVAEHQKGLNKLKKVQYKTGITTKKQSVIKLQCCNKEIDVTDTIGKADSLFRVCDCGVMLTISMEDDIAIITEEVKA